MKMLLVGIFLHPGLMRTSTMTTRTLACGERGCESGKHNLGIKYGAMCSIHPAQLGLSRLQQFILNFVKMSRSFVSIDDTDGRHCCLECKRNLNAIFLY